MFEDFLKDKVKIIRKKTDFSGGLAAETQEVIAEEKCRKTSPNQRDFQQIQHQQINKQIWKIYLKADSQFQDWDLLSIENKDYTPLYRYEVAGKEKVHHIKILALRV